MHKKAKQDKEEGKMNEPSESDGSDGDQNMFEDLGGSNASDSDDGAIGSGGGNAKKRSGGDREFQSKGKVHADKLKNKRAYKEATKSKKLNQQKGIIKSPSKPKQQK